jgi:hypothetical protein
MTRITNELFESIRQITHPIIAEDNLSGNEIKEKKIHPNQQVLDVHEPEKDELTAKDFEMLRAGKKQKAVKQGVQEGRVDAAHFCATHVEHDLYGEGECISEAHADPDEHGNISWYTVQFADGVRKVQTEAVKVKKGKMHEHAEAEAESIEEGTMGHAGTVTMKQVNKSNASPAVKAAIKKAAPDIKSYGDRAAALDAAGIKRESVEQVTELSTGTLLKVKHAAVRDANDATRDSDDARADKRYNLAGKASNKIELRNRAAGLKPSGQHSMDEGISETIVKHNDFTIEITNNPTYGDFLRAVQSIVRTDEESIQQEIVAIAEEAYAENYEDVIIEAFTRMEIDDKMAAHRKAGNTVSNDKFSTKNGQPYAEYVVTDKEGGRKKYIHHGSVRRMESMPGKTAKSSKEE